MNNVGKNRISWNYIDAWIYALKSDPVTGGMLNEVKHRLAFAIIENFLGLDWMRENVDARENKGGYLREPWESSDLNWNVHISRLVQIAEHLVSLQNVMGFNGLIKRIRGNEIESTVCEMDFARWLFETGHRFRFVTPSDVASYDMEIFVKGEGWIPTEIKSKISASSLEGLSIENSFKKARKQLKRNSQCFLAIIMPDEIVRTYSADIHDALKQIDAQCRSLMSSSDRIVSIKIIYSEEIYIDEKNSIKYMSCHEVNKVESVKSWDIFDGGKTRIGVNNYFSISDYISQYKVSEYGHDVKTGGPLPLIEWRATSMEDYKLKDAQIREKLAIPNKEQRSRGVQGSKKTRAN